MDVQGEACDWTITLWRGWCQRRVTDTAREGEIETERETAVTARQRDPSLAIQMQIQVWVLISAPLHSQVTFHLKSGGERKTAVTTIIIITTTAQWIKSVLVTSVTTIAMLTTDLIATGLARQVRGEGTDRAVVQ